MPVAVVVCAADGRRARAAARMPGPGSYDPSMDLVRQRSTSASIAAPSSAASKKRPAESSAPGPGHYEVEQQRRVGAVPWLAEPTCAARSPSPPPPPPYVCP